MFEAAFADHVNLVLLGTSEKVLSVPALPACAFASVDSCVDSHVNSPDTTDLVLVPVPDLVLGPVTWCCNKEFVV